ncbi:MAG TPA: aminotransferase [Verrucomicrobiae bacterium]|nr:aminotransferase [Verrucomicrobiae bacterium]
MKLALNPLLAAVAPPPIAEAHSWIEGRRFPAEKPLIDVAQAVPGYPPPPALTDHLAAIVGEAASARYTDILGLPALRAALARDMGDFYGASLAAEDVGITAGCNQAFCLALLALARAGEEVILPLPYYFNHQMWFDMQGVTARHLPFRPERGGVPDPADAAALIGPKTRAIVLVTPNNPTGAIYPQDVIAEFFDLARRHDLALVVDETYRDFLPTDDAPHGLFALPGWRDTLVQLYSFSKVYCLTGYRVGSVIAGPALLAEIAKAMDTVAICAPRLGQMAAIYGIEHLGEWRRGNTALMRGRLAALLKSLARNDLGYRLVSAGAYFAYLTHPFDGRPAAQVARRLADEQNVLALPGSMFGPGQEEYLRIAFANAEAAAMPALAERLAADAARG